MGPKYKRHSWHFQITFQEDRVQDGMERLEVILQTSEDNMNRLEGCFPYRARAIQLLEYDSSYQRSSSAPRL